MSVRKAPRPRQLISRPQPELVAVRAVVSILVGFSEPVTTSEHSVSTRWKGQRPFVRARLFRGKDSKLARRALDTSHNDAVVSIDIDIRGRFGQPNPERRVARPVAVREDDHPAPELSQAG